MRTILVDGGTADLVEWTLTDHLSTVRDIAKYDPGTDTTTVVNHLVYDAFGRVTSESNPAVGSLFLFTARPLDADTGLQNNLHRWYDSSIGRWLSEDPLGYGTDDFNLYRYLSGDPLNETDPSSESPSPIACAGACGAAIVCLGPGVAACASNTSSFSEFADCMKYYWSLLPTWEQWVCGGASAGCLACGYKWVLTKIKPPPPKRPVCPPYPRSIQKWVPCETIFVTCWYTGGTQTPPCIGTYLCSNGSIATTIMPPIPAP